MCDKRNEHIHFYFQIKSLKEWIESVKKIYIQVGFIDYYFHFYLIQYKNTLKSEEYH